MRMHRKIIGPLRSAIVFMALAGFLMSAGCKPKNPAGGPPQGAAPEVAVVTLSFQPVVLTTELPGRTVPYRIAEIRPQVSGLVLKRLFTEGSNVQAGQVLYQIDPAPFQAVLDNAKATLDKAEAQLVSVRLRAERYRDLVADKAVSRQDYDDAAAAEKQAMAEIEYWKATIKTALINLGYTRVTAPISGRIGKSNVTDGAIVTAYQPLPLATIQQLDPIYVDVPQSTTDLLRLERRLKDGRLKKNVKDQNKVRLILEDGTPYPIEGILQFSDVTVDPTTGSVILRVVLPNPEGIILPGMFVQAVIKEGANEQAILIPQQGVSRDSKGNPFVLIVDAESKVSSRQITLDRAVNNKWLVSAGLAPGDRVIIEGMQRARPGTTVKAVPYNEKQADNRPPAGPETQSEKRSQGGK